MENHVNHSIENGVIRFRFDGNPFVRKSTRGRAMGLELNLSELSPSSSFGTTSDETNAI